MKRKHRNSLARSAMMLLCTLLGLVLTVMLCATFAFQYLLNAIGAPQNDLRTQLTSVISSIPLRSSPEEKQQELVGGRGSGITNILLIGQDRREGEDTKQARSDTMILCSFNQKTGQITMTSFLRDLYVPIPGHGSNRINAAYSIGGMELLRQTIQENFQVYIDGCVEVDFVQFTQIIDLLGGVQIPLRQDEADIINQETGSALTEGEQLLNGEQALAYSRIRYLDLDGDFSRTNRQRKVMTALAETLRSAQISKVIPTLSKVLPMITTDMKSSQILLLAIELLPQLSDAQIASQRIPADGSYTDQTIDGMAVLVADMEKSRNLLRQSLLEP